MLGIDTGRLYERLAAASIDAAVRHQNLAELREILRQAVPDLSEQYTYPIDNETYRRIGERKMRSLHAFQINCVLETLPRLGPDATIVDIGDSSGAHGMYVRATAPAGSVKRYLSVNLDPVAVDKVNKRGGEAILCRAEELDHRSVHADLFVSFETIEHLLDPVRFLHDLATKGAADHILFSVPYRRASRFGGYHLRLPDSSLPQQMSPEELHIMELSPYDWSIACRLAGFRTEAVSFYRQYPGCHPLRLMAPLWRRLDFEGYICILAKRDLGFAERYTGW
jgi:hypothetical protein